MGTLVTSWKIKTSLLIFSVVLVCLLVFPFNTTAIPEWRVQVVDEVGAKLPGVMVSQDWGDSFAENQSHTDDRFTDVDGVVVFPERRVRANGITRIARTVASLINPHGGSGPSSFLTVTNPGDGFLLYSKGKPPPGKLVVQTR